MLNNIKSIVAFLITSVALTFGAKADIGMGYPEANQFYGNHKFLLKSSAGKLTYPIFSLYRYLENDAVLELTGIFDNCDCFPPSNSEKIKSIIIKYIKLKPNGTKNCLARENPYLCGDQYSSKHTNIWSRTSPKTIKILERLYGEKISRDFAESRMVYQGDLYSSEVLYNDDFRVRKEGDGISGRIKVFFGKTYSYQIIEGLDSESYFEITDMDASKKFISINKSEKSLYEKKSKDIEKYKPAVL